MKLYRHIERAHSASFESTRDVAVVVRLCLKSRSLSAIDSENNVADERVTRAVTQRAAPQASVNVTERAMRMEVLVQYKDLK